jgi:hypothetical protein
LLDSESGLSRRRFLEKRYNDDIELEDAIHTAILTLKEGFEVFPSSSLLYHSRELSDAKVNEPRNRASPGTGGLFHTPAG